MQSKITESLYHIASYQLRQSAKQQLQLHSRQHLSPVNSVQTLFNTLLFTPPEYYAQIKKWMDIIYRLAYRELLHNQQHYQEEDIHLMCKQKVRLFIRNIIDSEWKNQSSKSICSTLKQEEQKNIHMNNTSFHNHRNRIKQEQPFQLMEKSIKHQHSMNQSIFHSPSCNYQHSCIKNNYLFDSEVILSYPPLTCELACSPPHYHTQSTTFLDKSKYRLKHEIKPDNSCENHNIQETQSKGHFLYGDQIDTIHEIFNVHDEIFAIITWKAREEQVIPSNSTLPVEYIRIFEPQTLAKHYKQMMIDIMISKGINRIGAE